MGTKYIQDTRLDFFGKGSGVFCSCPDEAESEPKRERARSRNKSPSFYSVPPVRVPHNLKDLRSGSSYPLVSSKMAYRSYLCLIKLSSPGAVGSSLDIVGNDHLAARYTRGD